jgi:hypothetical protein
MTTIRDELTDEARDAEWATNIVDVDEALRILDIDPDLPAEWATVDHCLTWLRDRGFQMDAPVWSVGGPIVAGWTITVYEVDGGPRFTQAAPTIHAALIAACQALREEA